MEALVLAISVLVPLIIAVFLFVTLARSIQKERGSSGVKKVWSNFGLSLTFAILFLVSWISQGFAEWGVYASEQALHRAPATISDFIVQFAQSTLENWQSEFLQLFSFVVLAALLIHLGSAESKDSDEKMEQMIRSIAKDVEDLKGATGIDRAAK